MSKMDNLRAMREAKYAAAQRAASSATPAARSTPSKPQPVAKAPAAKASASKASASKAPAAKGSASEAPYTATDELCGHRNMSGRTCTRDKGHAAKSHRYS